MHEVRHAKENKYIDADTLIRSIRTPEYKSIIMNYYGELPEMSSFNMFEVCRDLMKKIPNEKLHNLFINELKKRKSNIEIIDTYNKELRQLCLAMNINAISYKVLDEKLSKSVNL